MLRVLRVLSMYFLARSLMVAYSQENTAAVRHSRAFFNLEGKEGVSQGDKVFLCLKDLTSSLVLRACQARMARMVCQDLMVRRSVPGQVLAGRRRRSSASQGLSIIWPHTLLTVLTGGGWSQWCPRRERPQWAAGECPS